MQVEALKDYLQVQVTVEGLRNFFLFCFRVTFLPEVLFSKGYTSDRLLQRAMFWTLLELSHRLVGPLDSAIT